MLELHAPLQSAAPALLFLGVYLLLLCGVAALIYFATPQGDPTALRLTRFGRNAPAPAALRAVGAFSLGALAGIPPSVYFFAKLGLLATLMSLGHPALAVALGLILLGAWSVYLRAALLLLRPTTALPTTAMRAGALAPLAANILVCLVLFAVFGAIGLSDLLLMAAYLS